MEIRYIWHDCFLVQSPWAAFVFDYWLDDNGESSQFPSFLDDIDPALPLFVLVSHSHKDHFNPAVFAWTGRFPHIHYIVSKDVMRRIRHVVSPTSVYSGPKVEADRVVELRPGQSANFGNVTIAAFPSTDTGNSYIVEIDSLTIFHAGDLNAWIWKDESTEQEIAKALGDYRACLRDIDAWLREHGHLDRKGLSVIDYCFFPVDSRIGRDYFTGAQIFVREFDVRNFIPMHFAFGDAEERARRRRDALRFDLYANTARGKYVIP